MQDIIKPDSGIKEIDEMKTTIHRQELLYVKLKAEQEKVIKNMEMLIQRREFIKLRYPVDKFGVSSSSKILKPKTTINNSQKELNELKEHIKHIENKKNAIVGNLRTQGNRLEETNGKIENIEIETGELQSKLFNYQNEYFINKLSSNNLFCGTKQNQDCTRMLEDFRDNKYKPRKKDASEKETQKFKTESEMLLTVLRNLGDTHPEWIGIINNAINI